MDIHMQVARILTVISLLQLAILISFASGELIPAINLTCPEYFSEEEVEKVNCSAASCLPYPTTVDFYFHNTSFNLLCSVSYDGKCDEEPVGEMNCSCVESHGGVNTYQLNFLGNKSVYEGGNLLCFVECYLSVPFPSVSSCTSLKYSTTSTSDTTTITVETESAEISTVTTSITRKTINGKTATRLKCQQLQKLVL